MKKTEMMTELANETGLTKADVQKVFEATFELFKKELSKGEKVSVAGFGTFNVSHREARTGRNPQTGESVKIPARNAVVFKSGTELKNVVNK